MLDELYSNAYIYTLPSDLEGMPLSLLEAIFYNTVGGMIGGLMYCAAMKARKRL